MAMLVLCAQHAGMQSCLAAWGAQGLCEQHMQPYALLPDKDAALEGCVAPMCIRCAASSQLRLVLPVTAGNISLSGLSWISGVALVAKILAVPLCKIGCPCHAASSQLRLILASDNNLSGPFPSSLGQLQNLQELHLDNNQLTGTMPPASPGDSTSDQAFSL